MKIDKIVIKTIFMVLRIVVVAVIAMLIYKGATMAYDYGYRVFAEEPMSAAPGLDMDIVVEDGMGPKEIGVLLEGKGLIKDGTLFYLQNILSKYKGDLKAGTYTLNTSMTTEEMMAVISGEVTTE